MMMQLPWLQLWLIVLCSLQDMATLRDFIAYSRTYIHPGLSEEAGQALVQAYVGMLYVHIYHKLSCDYHVIDMRKIGSSRGAVTAYPRQLESLIRLAEAHAKMRLVT